MMTRMNTRTQQKTGNWSYFKWILIFILPISMLLYIAEQQCVLGFRNPSIPLIVFVVFWIYIFIQIAGISILNNSTYWAWISLNISSLGILLLFIGIFSAEGFYLSDYILHFQFPVLSLMSIILLFKNNHLRKKIKWNNKEKRLGYLMSISIPLLIASVFYLIYRV